MQFTGQKVNVIPSSTVTFGPILGANVEADDEFGILVTYRLRAGRVRGYIPWASIARLEFTEAGR